MAWNQQLAVAMHNRALKGDFEPGFMVKLAHKDCRLAMAMNASARARGAGRRRDRRDAGGGDGQGARRCRRRRGAEAARGCGGGERAPAGEHRRARRREPGGRSSIPRDDVAVLVGTGGGGGGGASSSAATPAGPIAETVTAGAALPLGHKLAVRALAEGAVVRKYGEVIGRMTARRGRGGSRPRPQSRRACGPEGAGRGGQGVCARGFRRDRRPSGGRRRGGRRRRRGGWRRRRRRPRAGRGG